MKVVVTKLDNLSSVPRTVVSCDFHTGTVACLHTVRSPPPPDSRQMQSILANHLTRGSLNTFRSRTLHETHMYVVRNPIGLNVYKHRTLQLRAQQLMDLESAEVFGRLVLNVLKARMAELIISKDLNTWLLKSETQRYRNSSF